MANAMDGDGQVEEEESCGFEVRILSPTRLRRSAKRSRRPKWRMPRMLDSVRSVGGWLEHDAPEGTAW